MSSNLHKGLVDFILSLDVKPGEYLHFADCDHNDPEVVAIFADPEVVAALKAKGLRGIALEGDQDLNAYNGDPQQLRTVLQDRFLRLHMDPEYASHLADAYVAAFAQQGPDWQVRFADTNRAALLQQSLTPGEWDAYQDLMETVSRGNFSDSLDSFGKKFSAFSPEQRTIYLSMSRKVAEISGGNAFAKELAKSIIHDFGAASIATSVGRTHFTEHADLDELLPGKTIAVAGRYQVDVAPRVPDPTDYVYFVAQDRVRTQSDAMIRDKSVLMLGKPHSGMVSRER